MQHTTKHPWGLPVGWGFPQRGLIVFLFLGLIAPLRLGAQTGMDPAYTFEHSASYVQDKNFYLFTLIEKLPQVKTLLERDPVLSQLNKDQEARIAESVTACDTSLACWLNAWTLAEAAQQKAGNRLVELVKTEKGMQDLVRAHMRASGAFAKYASKTDEELLLSAWKEAMGGLTFIFDTYALGKRGRYPNIDSASYDVKSRMYRTYLLAASHALAEDLGDWTLWFQPNLAFALNLLDMNNRDEAGRHEPMAYGENQKAVEYIPGIDWSKYPYSVIMQPGHGPDIADIPLSPMGKLRVKLVAERYHKGMAPLIILSGGYVHPYQTPFAEATEMKKALIEQYGVPERAIIIEPHARHTTTNFRNSARLMYRYGIPFDKMALCTSTMDQVVYITNPAYQFKERNLRELGYLPYELFQKISPHDVEFKPVITSLHLDPLDPLDP